MANLPKPTNQDRKRATAQHIKPLAYGSYIDTRTGVFEAEGKKEILPGNLPIKNILASDNFSHLKAEFIGRQPLHAKGYSETST